jgi:hypothetical protein
VFPERDLEDRHFVCVRRDFWLEERLRTYVICPGVAKDVVEGVSFGYVLGWFTDDDGELYLIIREVLLGRLCRGRDDNRGVRTDYGGDWLVEENGETGRGL